jgi:hypothetical protein
MQLFSSDCWRKIVYFKLVVNVMRLIDAKNSKSQMRTFEALLPGTVINACYLGRMFLQVGESRLSSRRNENFIDLIILQIWLLHA